jgi:hypothetical protein
VPIGNRGLWPKLPTPHGLGEAIKKDRITARRQDRHETGIEKEFSVRKLIIFTALLAVAAMGFIAVPQRALAQDFVVYGVFRELDLGNPTEPAQKDYYINMGAAQGLRAGSVVQVSRRMATYDLLAEKLYKDVLFPIADLKVIHVEGNAAIARMDKMLPPEKTPAMFPRAVMVGDVVTSR